MPGEALELRTFEVDVTPPVGDYLCGGLHDPSTGVETPLSLRGIILSTAEEDVVLASIDFCYLCGASYGRLLEAIAEGARLTPERVTVHANHLHDAPLVDEETHGLLSELVPGMNLHNEAWFAELLERVRATVDRARKGAGITMGGVAFSQHPVERFASSRRVLDESGRCRTRYSVCRDAELRDMPEGLIDPMLDAIVFYDADNAPKAFLSFYASHPQVSDGRGLISSDTIGVARDLFESRFPGVFPIHFTGCGGDVTAGKYTTTHRERNRLVFGLRLFDAMEAAFTKANPAPCGALRWAGEAFDVPLRPVDEDEAVLLKIVEEDPWRSRRYVAGVKLLRLRRGMDSYSYRAARLSLGDAANLLFLPAEMCVEYQLYAKRQCRGPLAVAAYGDCFLKYVATDEAFTQGGYEVEPMWTEVGPGIEPLLKDRLKALLESAGS